MKTMRYVFVISLFAVLFIFVGCAQQSSNKTAPPKSDKAEFEPRFTYHEFDMICLFYRTNDIVTYEKLLPKQFAMPKEPMVMVFVADYYDMDKATQPYQEAAVFLMINYQGAPGWYCVTMPVTSDDARFGGIHYLGYPKIMGDVSLQRNADQLKGILKLNDKLIVSVDLNTRNHSVTHAEKLMFERLKGLPSLNILRGKVFRVKFGKNAGQYSLLDLAAMYPDALEVRVGKSQIFLDADAAGRYSQRLGDVFSIRPTQILLAYYLKNKTTMRFEN